MELSDTSVLSIKNPERYFIRLSFNGKDFHGWQIQENAGTVQLELNNALSVLFHTNIQTTGCGRTDTGVHAKKFFAHFDLPAIPDPSDSIHHLNAILPPSIAIQNIFPVNGDSHSRFSATSRTYVYRIYKKKNPFLRESSYYFSPEIDIDKMNHIAKLLLNHSDFSSFSKSRTQTFTNNCRISSAHWSVEGEEIIFTITADRFLRNMVRAIVGTLLQAGTGKIGLEEFQNILSSGNRSEAGISVPAHGLYLTDISYPFPVF